MGVNCEFLNDDKVNELKLIVKRFVTSGSKHFEHGAQALKPFDGNMQIIICLFIGIIGYSV